MTIRALIVDDEPLTRRGIRRFLAKHSEIEIAGECADGLKAVQSIRSLAPDLVLLDIQMPEMTGFEVIAQIGREQMPSVIFVTAYNQYALQAFDAHAIDYVLKPIDERRFDEAIDRAVARLRASADDDRLDRLLREFEALRPKRIFVRDGRRIVFIDLAQIDHIEAAENYVRLHVGNKSHLMRQTMAELESMLNPAVFVRIHRSQIVNVAAISELRPLLNGSYVVVLKSGVELISSRRFRSRIEAVMENRLR